MIGSSFPTRGHANLGGHLVRRGVTAGSMWLVLALSVSACGKRATAPSVQPAPQVMAEEPAPAPVVESAPAAEPAPEPVAGAPSPEPPAAPAAPPPPVVDPVDAEITDVVALMTKGGEADLLRARERLDALVASSPDRALAWYNLGVVRREIGDRAGAADAFARAVRLDATLGDAWVGFGEVELEKGDLAAALREFERGLASAPDNGPLLVARVSALRRAGRAKDAVDAAKAALLSNALELGLYHEMGRAWLDLGKPALARFVFEKAEAIKGGTESAMIQGDLGWALHLDGEHYAAKKRLERAVELDPKHLPSLVSLARVLFEDRNYPKMIELLETARDLDPNNRGVWTNLGIAYRGAGRADDARRAFERALDLDPASPMPLFNLGVLLADDLKDYDAALRRFQQYLDAGGAEADRARAVMAEVETEKERAERKARLEERRRERDAAQKEREKLLQEQGAGEGTEGGTP